MGIKNALATNARVLREQWKDFVVHTELDWANGRKRWAEGRYGKALHNFIEGPIGEFYEHCWRWVKYRDQLLVLGALVWLGISLTGS